MRKHFGQGCMEWLRLRKMEEQRTALGPLSMEKLHGMGLYLATQGTTLETWSWVGEHCFKGTGRSSQDQYPEEEREFEQRLWYNLWPVWQI